MMKKENWLIGAVVGIILGGVAFLFQVFSPPPVVLVQEVYKPLRDEGRYSGRVLTGVVSTVTRQGVVVSVSTNWPEWVFTDVEAK